MERLVVLIALLAALSCSVSAVQPLAASLHESTSPHAHGQKQMLPAAIVFTMYDKVTHLPIPNVTVSIVATGFQGSVQSDAGGLATFAAVFPGTNTFYMEHPSYFPQTFTILVEAGQLVAISQEFNLVPKSFTLGSIDVAVVDAFSLGPVSGFAEYVLSGPRYYSGPLGLNGILSIPGLPDGIYTINVSVFGYFPIPGVVRAISDGKAVQAFFYAHPIPEDPGAGMHHSADRDQDNKVGLSELLRGIQFFNVGEFFCDPATEDGYVPGPGDGETSCTPHACDYNPQDWVISLSELLRLIQFFNSEGYHSCPDSGTEDGFCPWLPAR